jgi:hypothetical protein
MDEEKIETPLQRALSEDEQRAENQRIFLREHMAQAVQWQPTGSGIYWNYSGIGDRLIETPKTTGTDDSGLKA